MRLTLLLLCLAPCASASTNPFEGQTFYINPANQAEYDSSIATATGDEKANLQLMRDVPSAYWIDVKAKIKGNGTQSVEGILKDASSKSPAELVVLIWYDFPNRDCKAKASNGEICCVKNSDGTCNYNDQSGDCSDGIAEYKNEYVDPFISVLQEYDGKVPIVIVFEPDSLPNLASNMQDPHCGGGATVAAYKEGAKYALQQLATKTSVTIYIDAAHGGWLGWENNLEGFMNVLKELSLPWNRIRGFATNVANYQPMGAMCPWQPDQGYRNGYCLNGKHASDPCCKDPCKLISQWNPGNGEFNYAQALTKAATGILGSDFTVVIDTGRNGVDDMREDCSNWCNIRGAGAGRRSTAKTDYPFIDAYYWLKTPGESDGCTQTLPSGGQCKRFDAMCGSEDSIGSQSSEPRAPEAGKWFDYQVKMLAKNAELGPSPGPSPPAPPTPPAPPSPPSPPAPPSPPSPSGCPGGSLQNCMNMCPSDPAAFQACVKTCQQRCSGEVVV